MHYSKQPALLHGKTPFKDVQRDRAHADESPVGSGQPAPTRLAPRSKRPPRDPPRAA
jgi:hypothetical protein